MSSSANSSLVRTLLKRSILKKDSTELKVKRPDNFYWINHAFFPGSSHIHFNHDNSFSNANYDLLNAIENLYGTIVSSRLTAWLKMSICLVHFNAQEYHGFQLQVCVLIPSIKLLPFRSLTSANLTVSRESRFEMELVLAYQDNTVTKYVLRKRRHCPVVVHINREDLNTDQLVCFPLNKTKAQYIAHGKENVKSVQESVNYDRKETDVVRHVNGCLENIVTNTESLVIPDHFQHSRKYHARHELVSPHKQLTGRTKLGLQNEYLKRTRSTSRHHEIPVVNLTSRKSSLIIMHGKKSMSRPATKGGRANIKVREIAHEETQTGASSLEFSTQWNAYNVLRKSAHQHSLQVVCLSTRDVPFDSFSSTIQSLSREYSSNQQRTSPLLSVRHQVRQEHMATRQLERDTIAACALPPSSTRDIDRDYTELRLTHVPFDGSEITQLLHASDYSKIIQQVGTIPTNLLQPDSLIPLHFISGVAYFKISKYKEAQKHFKKCESVSKRANRDGDVMLCNAYLGDIEYASRSYSEAARYYKAAIAHHAAGNVAPMFKLTPPTLSAIHAKLASAYRSVSMMVQAIQHYRTAMKEANTDRDRLSAHTSLGNLYQSMGDNSSALKEYKESITLAEKLTDQVSLGWAHGNIGNAYLGLNKKDEALYHLQKSLELAIEYEQTPQAIGRTYNNLGTAYQSMNDLDKAEEYYDLALSQAVYGNDIHGQARVYGNIGNVHMLRKNYERAVPRYAEVLHLSTDPSTVSTARHNRGCAYYEWATSLVPKNKKPGTCTINEKVDTRVSEYQCTFHGPDCDVDVCLSHLSSKAKELFNKGCDDLKEVVKYHEEKLQHIKGSPSGLTLSVSLFETNSRTFHRLQDCLVNLHKYDEALVVAEQSRARTLGELLLKRKRGKLMKSLNSPLNFDEIASILQPLESPVLYFSYTGARLICWLFFPHQSGTSMHTFDIPLADDQFNGKSFDHLLRYSLTENLVERSFEMYQHIRYDAQSSEEVQALYRLIGQPTLKILQKYMNSFKTQQVTTISDSYTSLLPLTCLFDDVCNSFLGDRYVFNQMPSFLTMGIINQFPSAKVYLGEDSWDLCILGDPNIPPFYHNGDLWNLGRLPHARKEAEWVAHALQTIPVLGEQATKTALLNRLMKAKVVHIATHGSASAGFLAFSSFAVHANERSLKGNQVHGGNILLYPEEVEKLNISPALVVLSSCDSGRGTVKADGIQGMARAFILAGAQSVLTTLWKIPDESASVFMQFFYQYLLDGMKSSFALQKAILSVRCFAKYSQYIHWSGYQLTGRDIQFLSKPSHLSTILKDRLGEPSVFPRLASVKKLEKAFVNSPCFPTDVQIVKGCAGIKPEEVVIDFVSSFYNKFSGGIFWINCLLPELLNSSIEHIQKMIKADLDNLPISEIQQALFIFDNMSHLPASEALFRVLRNQYVHIIALSKPIDTPSELVKEIDQKLIRGCTVHHVEPLTMIHSTQRIIHSLLKKLNVTPTNYDQDIFEKLAEFTTGSPVITEIASQVVLTCYEQRHHDAVLYLNEMLSLEDKNVPKDQGASPNTSTENTASKLVAHSPGHESAYRTDSMYDSWESILKLIQECNLSPEERLLLSSLSLFRCCPIPFSLVTEISALITRSGHIVHLTSSLYQKLYKCKLVKQYPQPVVLHELILKNEPPQVPEYLYVPQQVSQCLWNDMEDRDKVFALSVAYYGVLKLYDQRSMDSVSYQDISGICCLLHNVFEENYTLVGVQLYQEMCRLYFNCKHT